MKKIVRQEIFSLDGMPISVNMGKADEQGCYLEMLLALKSQFDAMLSYHSRVLPIRVDIKVPSYTPDNKLFSDFMRKLRKKIKRKDKAARVGFVWAREMEKAKRQHYHLVILLNQHVFNNSAYVIHSCVEPICEGWEWPKPYTPKNCYYVIKRGNQESYNTAFHRASYLCKVRGKGYKSKAANDYGRSHFKEKSEAA